MTRVVDELTRVYLEDVDDPLAREALEAASVVRRVTEPILAAMLRRRRGRHRTAAAARPSVRRRPARRPRRPRSGAGSGRRLSARDEPDPLPRLPAGGLARAADPDPRRGPGELWRFTADMLYLIDNPVVRDAFFPSGTQPLAVEPARADDEATVLASPPATRVRRPPRRSRAGGRTRRRRSRSSGTGTGRWPASTRSSRAACCARRSSPGDPVLEAWARDLREHPLPKAQIALGLRRWLDAERGRAAVRVAGGVLARHQARLHGAAPGAPTHVRRRPGRPDVLARRREARFPAARRSRREPRRRASTRASCSTSAPARSTAGWPRSWRTSSESPASRSSTRRRASSWCRASGCRSRRSSSALFRHLREREGAGVARRELLREVWGTEFTGGSNVVDAVVRHPPAQARRRGEGRGDGPRQRLPTARRLARPHELSDLIQASSKPHRSALPRS